MILTKVELGTIDPEDMNSGVQYGDVPRWDGSVRGPPRSILTLMGGTRTQTQAPRRPCC
uniref:ARAD1C28138p n=1 Tax=Blastobotrys adeninivorans TaxID=409370 RepID=A0A060T201_BLAAD